MSRIGRLGKSDRRVIIVLLAVIATASGIIWLTGGQQESNTDTMGDTIVRNDTERHAPKGQWKKTYHRVDTIYVVERRAPRAVRPRPSDTARTIQTTPLMKNTARHKIGPGEWVDLCSADTTMLMTVPGIGPYYARRIARYGERLGGYVSVAQIDEIGDVPQEVKAYLKIGTPQPRKLNVNRLSLEELRRHPYINFYQARAITDYRRLHGKIKSMDDLRLSRDFPEEAIERLLPYVEY